MKQVRNIRDFIAAGLVAMAFALVLASVLLPGSYDPASQAARLERRIERRLELLDARALKPERSPLPEDMVIYRYLHDSLYSWSNQFPIRNDDITSRIVLPRLSNTRRDLRPPLSGLSDTVSFVNLGPKWYLIKAVKGGPITVVEGLEVDASRLGLGKRFSIMPLDGSGGYPVNVAGKPCFKVICDNFTLHGDADAAMFWAGLLLLLAASLVFLSAHRSLKSFALYLAVSFGGILAMYLWGRTVQAEVKIFSPAVFAGGGLLYSLGAVLCINAAVFMFCAGLWLVRLRLHPFCAGRKRRVLAALLSLMFCALVALYSFFSIRSIIFDSGITLELHKFGLLNFHTLLVYLSYLSMLSAIPLVPSAFLPSWKLLSVTGRSVWGLVVALCLACTAMVFGFRKEQERIGVWANRLAMERDIPLEMQLKRMEDKFAADRFVAALAQLENSADIIRNRVLEGYLPRLSPEYEVRVTTVPGDAGVPSRRQVLRSVLDSGTPIFENSRFVYSIRGGHVRYDGVFPYFSGDGKVSVVLVEVESVLRLRDGGYAGLLGLSGMGGAPMPSFYSYAKYEGGKIVYYKGTYAYPTRMDNPVSGKADGYVHFVNRVSDSGDIIVISRPKLGWFNYVVYVLLIGIVVFLFMTLFTAGSRRYSPAQREYFKTRINWVMVTSLFMTLVILAVVSVIFVYRRNEVNQGMILADKAGSLQLMVQKELRALPPEASLRSPEAVSAIEAVSANTGADITLYAPDGLLLISTCPEVFEHMLLGCRMDEDAFREIMQGRRRYYAHKEKLAGMPYYGIYVPLFDQAGQIRAVLCSPYTERSYDLRREAVMHLMAILSVFLILFIVARFTVSRVVDGMFRPLLDMGGKMNRAGAGSLEKVEYDRDDEISSLVRAYNGMVEELARSSRQLAQAERDKAWSGMARQVAHEIKNPLTPMKLQLQRIIRLKQKGGEAWQDKFDEMTTVLLDHIEILTDTANEFSDFAKLYTQEPVLIDLNALLEAELAMFDGRESVEFSYFGLAGAEITGPKPQLTRVFDNIINNSVQAVEGVSGGKVQVSLRKSVSDGYYDIVFEDNGPGVSEENVEKLFTPNFTTKNGGTGLGLAISKSVLERCGADIFYSRSFSLGGACFTVRYPI